MSSCSVVLLVLLCECICLIAGGNVGLCVCGSIVLILPTIGRDKTSKSYLSCFPGFIISCERVVSFVCLLGGVNHTSESSSSSIPIGVLASNSLSDFFFFSKVWGVEVLTVWWCLLFWGWWEYLIGERFTAMASSSFNSSWSWCTQVCLCDSGRWIKRRLSSGLRHHHYQKAFTT